jgi:ATP-dependent helicase 41
LGICASSRIRSGAENSYALVKAISEEIRGLAVEQNCAVWSATQTNRGSWENSDFGLEAISESTGQAMTADMILALIETEQLALQGQQLVKQLKSRYADRNQNSHFILGVSKSKQKYFECETQRQVNSQQNKIEETSAKLEKQVIQSKLQTSQEKRSSMEEIQW